MQTGNDMPDLVKRLRDYCMKNQISKIALAQELGVSYQSVRCWFKGETKPSPIYRYHIEELLRKKWIRILF